MQLALWAIALLPAVMSMPIADRMVPYFVLPFFANLWQLKHPILMQCSADLQSFVRMTPMSSDEAQRRNEEITTFGSLEI